MRVFQHSDRAVSSGPPAPKFFSAPTLPSELLRQPPRRCRRTMPGVEHVVSRDRRLRLAELPLLPACAKAQSPRTRQLSPAATRTNFADHADLALAARFPMTGGHSAIRRPTSCEG